jgi:hypothetical protein
VNRRAATRSSKPLATPSWVLAGRSGHCAPVNLAARVLRWRRIPVTDKPLPPFFTPFVLQAGFPEPFSCCMRRPWKKLLNFVYGVVCFPQTYCSSSYSTSIHQIWRKTERGQKKRLNSFPAPQIPPLLYSREFTAPFVSRNSYKISRVPSQG